MRLYWYCHWGKVWQNSAVIPPVWQQPRSQHAHREQPQCSPWQMSIMGWGVRAWEYLGKADEGTKDTVNWLDYRQNTSEDVASTIKKKKKIQKTHNFHASPFMLVILEERKKTLHGTMRKFVQKIRREWLHCTSRSFNQNDWSVYEFFNPCKPEQFNYI